MSSGTVFVSLQLDTQPSSCDNNNNNNNDNNHHHHVIALENCLSKPYIQKLTPAPHTQCALHHAFSIGCFPPDCVSLSCS